MTDDRCDATMGAFPEAPESGFACRAKDLVTAVQTARAVVDRKQKVPIIQHVLLRPQGGGMAVVATNLDQEMVWEVPGRGEAPFAAVVPEHLLGVLHQAEGTAELRLDGRALELSAAGVKAKLPTLPGDDFPDPMPQLDWQTDEVEAAAMKHAIGKVAFACLAAGDPSLIKTGIYFEPDTLEEGASAAVATDAHRIAYRRVALPPGPPGLLPKEAAQHLTKMPGGLWTIDRHERMWRVRGNGWSYATKLIDDKYPPWRKVIPTDFDGSFSIDKAAMLTQSKRLASLGAGKTPGITLSHDGGEVVMTMGSLEGASGTARILAAHIEGELPPSKFQPRYIDDFMTFSDEAAPKVKADVKKHVLVLEEEGGLTAVVGMNS